MHILDEGKVRVYRYDLKYASLEAMDGVSWKLWLFNFVDDFRRHRDPAYIPLVEPLWPSIRDAAMAHSTCAALLDEAGVAEEKWPAWLRTARWLPEPWFVAGMDSLMATAILESPIWYRRNNIWVMGNFLSRV